MLCAFILLALGGCQNPSRIQAASSHSAAMEWWLSQCARPASAPVLTRTGLITPSLPASGRIYETRRGPDNLRWFWSMTVTVRWRARIAWRR